MIVNSCKVCPKCGTNFKLHLVHIEDSDWIEYFCEDCGNQEREEVIDNQTYYPTFHSLPIINI